MGRAGSFGTGARRLMEPIRLTEMAILARGEVTSKADLIALHRQKKTRPDNWFVGAERILQHRKQVVSIIDQEIERRAASRDERKQA